MVDLLRVILSHSRLEQVFSRANNSLGAHTSGEIKILSHMHTYLWSGPCLTAMDFLFLVRRRASSDVELLFNTCTYQISSLYVSQDAYHILIDSLLPKLQSLRQALCSVRQIASVASVASHRARTAPTWHTKASRLEPPGDSLACRSKQSYISTGEPSQRHMCFLPQPRWCIFRRHARFAEGLPRCQHRQTTGSAGWSISTTTAR
jgi:hypothetical protein